MGAVYLAHDSQLDRKIALKIPRFSSSDKSEETERFYREARAAATLRHPNICQVFDIGMIDGQHFISMEYISGNPLSVFIKQSKPLPVRKIASTLRQLARALQEAHDNGLVHRDLKPDNIMIDERGEPIIMDFGLVRLMDDDDRLTTSGAIVGSPAYMSPEQVSGMPGDVGPSSDIFSLGTITYELLTRRRPFRGNLSTIFDQITSADPPLPSELRPDIDSDFESICLHMLAKEVSDRFGSMKDLADAVGHYLKGSSTSSILSSSSLPSSSSETAPAVATSPDEEAARWVLKIGGTLKVSTNESQSVAVADLKDLPDSPFHVVDIALLKNGDVDDEGLKFLSGLDKLLVLRLSETNVTDEGVACLGGLTSLPVLDLSYTKVTDAGLKHLKNMKGLKQLDLANTNITDLGLAQVKRLRGLQFLGLYATGVTDAGLKTLSRLKNLQFLGLYGTKVTDAGVAGLKKSLRNCTISR
jgi:serine/threonine protein kinase